MTVSSIASIAATIANSVANQKSSNSSSSTDIATSVASLLSASSTDASGDSDSSLLNSLSSIANATGLQAQLASLRAATQNVAQTGALVSTASSGVSEISKVLDQMQDLTQEASADDLSSSERATLDGEFQALRAAITRIANDTTFEGQGLLDGSLNSSALQQLGSDSSDTDSGSGFSIADLRDSALFGNSQPDLLSASDAQAASQAVSTAQNTVDDQQATLDEVGQSIDLAFGSLQTASQNQEAASSTLTEDDLLGASDSSNSQQTQLQAQAQQALAAQTSKLPNNILSLLAE